MSVAPQRWILLYCKLACHGQSPVSADDSPPTIRNDDDFAIDLTDLFCRNPQTVKRRKSVSAILLLSNMPANGCEKKAELHIT